MTRPEDHEEEHELIRPDAPGALAGPEALARILEQSNREQAASRAQARELVRALEGVQRSQEFLGEALREERKKSRGFLVLLVLGPALAVAGAWYVLRHVDDAKSDVERRIVRMAADEEAARAEDFAKLSDTRAAQLSGDVESLRRDLDASREALAAERRHVAEREAALAAAETRTESARTEISALEVEVKTARARQRTEEQRATALEGRLREAQAEAKAAAQREPPPPPPVAAAAPAAPAAPSVGESKPAAETRPASPPPPPAQPTGDPSAAANARLVLNSLLKDSGDAVRYEFSAIRAVSGGALLDVVAVGTDERGNVIRSIQAGRAEIVVDSTSRSVVLRFYDGKLLIGGKSAPFFDGTYGLVVRGDPAKWRAAALSFVKSE